MPDPNTQRQKILIVDDNKQNIEMLMALFKDQYRITAAIRPDRAIKIATSDAPPDIILLDILMPEMDGYEVCAILKEDERSKEIPIIFVTAVSEVMDAARGFELGAVDYITKPFHPPMVQARVDLHLTLKRRQELLEKYAFIDALTEIPNRRRFDEVLEKEWNRALRSRQPMSILFMDLDDFKAFNDTYGHGKGDEALRKVAQEIDRSLRRAGDFVARYGGEEFAAILPYTQEEKALSIAEQIGLNVQNLGIQHASSRVAQVVTLSIGVTTAAPHESVPISSLVEMADQALYDAKRQGRNRVCLAPQRST